MAAVPKVVTVDLGSSTIRVGEFGIGKGGTLTLLRFGVAELGLDPNKEEDRAKFITPTLSKLLRDQGIKGRDVVLSISGQSVFMRFVKLPAVDPGQVEQMVTFEAQQNVPFPIQDVTWDYQMMPNLSAGTDAEAVIVAIKKEILESEVAAVEAAGLRVNRVDVAPFALLNAFRYNEADQGDCVLVIDMGARSTNLLFLEKTSFWIRNVPIAGNQISQSICNEMQEPFISAEMLKKGKGFVSLGGVYADPEDADAARISKLIRTTMTRLHVDINRSIAYYRTTLGGSAPKRVFITGGSSQLPYLDLFIGDKLNLPVAYLNPLRNVDIGPSVNSSELQRDSCYLSELVGLALRETGSCPAEVTLDAPTLAARASKSHRQPYYYGALVAWALLFVCLALYEYQQIGIANAAADRLTDKTQSLKQLAPAINSMAKQATGLNSTLGTVELLGQQRDAWPAILDALNSKIPPGVWITQFIPSYDASLATAGAGEGNRRGGGAGGGGGGNRPPPTGGGGGRSAGPQAPTNEVNLLVINGLYHASDKTTQVDSTKLSDFVKSLADLPYFDIDPAKTSATLISFTTVDTDPNSMAQKFSMHLKLKKPIILHP